jgi:hypothetical protein
MSILLLQAQDLPLVLEPVITAYGRACWSDCSWLRQHTNYGPGYWEQMMRSASGFMLRQGSLDSRGPLWAAVSLIRRGNGRPQSGYLRLLEMDQVVMTVEYSVLWLEWRPIFRYFPDVMDLARGILRRSGVTPPDEETT